MSEIERRRIRKEAGDAVTSKSPRPSDETSLGALRRYLGIEVFEMVRGRRRDVARRPAPPPSKSATLERQS